MQSFSESTIFTLRHQNTLKRPCWQTITAPRNDKTPVCHAERGLAFGGKTRRGNLRQAVPPTVRPSMRSVGWPTPTGTL